MQIGRLAALFFTTLLSTYLVLDMILLAYDEMRPLKARLTYTLLISLVGHIGVSLVLYALFGFPDFSSRSYAVMILPTPLLYLLSYGLGVWLFKMSPVKSISVMRQGYVYLLIVALGIRFFGRVLLSGQMQTYLGQMLGIAMGALVYLLAYFIFRTLLKRRSYLTHLSDAIPIRNRAKEFRNSIATMGSVYICVALLLLYLGDTPIAALALCGALAIYLMLDLSLLRSRALRNDLENKDIYMAGMRRALEDFSAITDGIGEVLYSYAAYIEKGDETGLKQYHEGLLNKTHAVADRVKLVRRMQENPELLSLFLQKMDYAQERGIRFHLPILCLIDDMYIDTFDLCRALNNVLDNAIEEALGSLDKQVTLSIEKKGDGSKLIVIANSTDKPASQSALQHWVPARFSRRGQGIAQARGILRRYANTTLQMTHASQLFSVYIELWENTAGQRGIVG